jgi:hypothetical protein
MLAVPSRAIGAALSLIGGAVDSALLKMAGANLGRAAVGAEAPEFAMVARFMSGGRSIYDRRFVQHEALELLVSFSGRSQSQVHNMTLAIQGIPRGPISQAYLYHPGVIQAFPASFNFSTRRIWGF